MTGAGAPGAAGILHCLSAEPAFQVVAADANPMAVGRWLSKDFETIPLATDPSFPDAVLSLCRKKNIHIVFPLVTKELLPLSQLAGELELAGARLPISTTASLEIANNKSKLYEFLQWRGLPVPAFRIIETVEQFKAAVKELDYPAKQVCFKPSVSNGSRGFRIIAEQANELDLLFNQKPNAAFLRFDEAVRILSSGVFPELLVSEYLPGEEYSVDCLAKKGEPVIIIPRLRKKMINGISVEGEFVRQEEIIDCCGQVIRELRLHGIIGMQFKKAVDGHFYLLEINPRVQGTIAATLGAGPNLPVLVVRQELGLPVDPAGLNVKWGTKFSRYWKEVFY